jgi:adenine-specific DNA glycosylase
MINQLLHMGKLVERPAQTVCETCPVRVSCIVIERSDRLYSVPMNTIKE